MADEPRPVFPLRLPRSQLIWFDTAVGVACTLLLLTSAIVTTDLEPGFDAPPWLQLLAAAAATLPVAVRRLWPRTVLTIVLAMSLLVVWLGLAIDVIYAPAFAVYMVAVTAPRRAWEPTFAIGALSAVGAVMLTAVGPLDMQSQIVATTLLGMMLMGGSWTIGRAVQERRKYAARTAEQRAEHAVTDERLRIARELHDIVAHSMSLIAVKAGIANHVMAVRPAEAHDALRVIETTSRDALIEMRHLLGVLRAEPRHDGAADLGPTPGLAGLPELVERAALADVVVTLDAPGATALPDGVGLAVFRIVQEAVTNVVKHAAPTRCQVTVTANQREVDIEVTDEGHGGRTTAGRPGNHRHAADYGGHGLVGMRERVTIYGGTFTAGPLPEGGFRVSARLPYEPASPAGCCRDRADPGTGRRRSDSRPRQLPGPHRHGT